MQARTVTFVTRKTVLRIFFIVLSHYRIPRDLRDDRRRGYRDALRIAPYYALDRAFRGKPHLSIYYYVIGTDCEIANGHIHGPERGLIYVYFVDSLLVDDAYSDDGFLKYLFVSALAPRSGELLRVIYLRGEAKSLTDDCAGYYRPRQRPPPRLIDAGYYGIPGIT